MTVSFSAGISIPENVMFRELEGEAVILNVDTDMYFGLDDVGTRMWTALTESNSIQDAYQALLDEYDVGADVLRRDLIDLVEKLQDKGLLELSNADPRVS